MFRSFSNVRRFTRPFMSSIVRRKSLTADSINRHVSEAQYAVRGELVIRADALRSELAASKPLPFSSITPCNIGNPHELGQLPITFFRQVQSLLQYPDLIKNPLSKQLFAEDAIERAQKYLQAVPSGLGAYSASQGVKVVREEVAAYIAERDNSPANADDIFLTDGASPGIKYLLQLLIRDDKDAILTPIPQYPLYSATITLLGGQRSGYYLDEKKGWTLSVSELKRSLNESRKAGLNVRALVVINPGNPTGQCLTAQNIKEIIEFAAGENLVILSDEVYQTNIYSKTPFTSFKKVLRSMGKDYEGVELASFHSVSKGFVGECGQRGGYVELVGFEKGARDAFYKLASISLCSNLPGQIMMGLQVNPPKDGDPSFKQYTLEKNAILESMKRRAKMLVEAFNDTPGVECNAVEGAMYAFPQVKIPEKALAAAKAAGKSADTFYCLALLEKTGIVFVPGSGFDQEKGTWHFRATILPPEAEFDRFLSAFKAFHKEFLAKYE